MARAVTLRTGISGVRGIVGESLTPDLLVDFGQAFGTYLRAGQVAVGRDTRPSGEMVGAAVIGGMLAAGCDVYDFGILPVPSLQIAVSRQHFDGGVAITASHNPQQWNALKFVRWDGVFLYPHQAEELLNIYYQGDFRLAGEESVGRLERASGAMELHLGLVLEATDTLAIRQAGLKVVVDCCNGAGALLAPRLLRELGCREVHVINGEPNGLFPRPPEPVPQNLERLCRAVVELGADVGFAQDADADRLAIVDERGRAVGEEYTLALAADAICSSRGAIPLVANMSTSRMIDEVARRYGCPIRRCPVGEIHVVQAMCEEAKKFKEAGLTDQDDWVFGGEGNGGVIDPTIHYCRDSHRAMAIILEGLAKRGGTVSQWIAEAFRPSAMVKSRIECPGQLIQQTMLRVREALEPLGHVDTSDGVKVTLPDYSWVHVRPSNTEPIIRVVAEADTEEEARRLVQLAKEAAGTVR